MKFIIKKIYFITSSQKFLNICSQQVLGSLHLYAPILLQTERFPIYLVLLLNFSHPKYKVLVDTFKIVFGFCINRAQKLNKQNF